MLSGTIHGGRSETGYSVAYLYSRMSMKRKEQHTAGPSADTLPGPMLIELTQPDQNAISVTKQSGMSFHIKLGRTQIGRGPAKDGVDHCIILENNLLVGNVCAYLERCKTATHIAHTGLPHRPVDVDGALLPRGGTKQLRHGNVLRFGVQRFRYIDTVGASDPGEAVDPL